MELIQFLVRSRFHVARRGLLVLLLIGLFLIGVVALAEAAPPAQSPEEGHAIFEQKCAACHTVGGGRLAGPDLRGVTARRDRDWLARWITEPDKMLAEGDPTATQLLQEYNNLPMPNMGLSEADVEQILAFLEHESAEAEAEEAPQPVQVPATAPAALPAGDQATGKDLFTGAIRLQNGGPSCIACHSVTGLGVLGGGNLGPDLTQAFTNYGEAGMTSVLANIPFPTMQPIFKGQPLTPEEQAHLAAFLQAAAAQQPRQATRQLGLLALVGFVVLMIVAQLVWRRRLQAIRRPLVEQV